MHGFKMKWFAVQFGRSQSLVALELPREYCGVVVIVAERFAIWRLMFFAKMRPG